MKRFRILKVFSIAIIMSLLVLAVPALPALAYDYDISIDPDSGQIGDEIEIEGDDFPESTESSERWAMIVFAENEADIGDYIDDEVDTYEIVGQPTIGYDGDSDEGEFTDSFDVPDELNDGDDDEDVSPGTYYICVAVLSESSESPYRIRAVEEFEVTGGGELNSLSPSSGDPGTEVTVSGYDFASSKSITIEFDNTTLSKSGDSKTDSSGDFESVITIPSTASVGTHTIYVTVYGTTVSKTFTVTASAALDPLSPDSGPAGTIVEVIGTNFPANSAIVFQFGTINLVPTSGDTVTRSDGLLISTITVPEDISAGAYTFTVTAGSSSASASFTVTASAAINLSLASGEAGTDVTVSGANFMASYPIIFNFGNTTLTPKSGDINTSTAGSFTSVITVPTDATVGANNITVTVGSDVLTTTFTVTESSGPSPSQAVLDINTSGDTIGSMIGIGGAGFTPGAEVTIKYDDTEVDTVQADADGVIMITFEAPASKSGAHTITVSDGTNTGTTTFTVESEAPETPPPLLPEMGAKEKFPITFDWEDVTDASRPVTYTLQIATDEDFAAGSIVFEETDITKSEFLLEELEELDLENYEGSLYWRVRALDAASNASSWTGAGEFTASGSLSFPGWATYTLIIVGGILLFLLGLWVGRRTAFYY